MATQSTFANASKTYEQLSTHAKEYMFRDKGSILRHELCIGCDENNFQPNQLAHMEPLGCLEQWSDMPDFVFEELYDRLVMRDLLNLYKSLLTYFNIPLPATYTSLYFTIDEMKAYLIADDLTWTTLHDVCYELTNQ